jgi:hypothetical protein
MSANQGMEGKLNFETVKNVDNNDSIAFFNIISVSMNKYLA